MMAQTEGRLISVSEISRAVNVDKSFENSRATIILDNANQVITGTESEQYLKGKDVKIYADSLGQRVEINFPSGWRYFSAIPRGYAGGDLIFSGQIADLPKSASNQLELIADIVTTGFNLEVNRVIKKSDYPNCPDANEGQYGNIIYGTADDTGHEGLGLLIAYRVDVNKYLAAWNVLDSLISCWTTAGVDISGSCVLSVVAGISYILYTSSDDMIYFNAYGTFSGGSLIDNPAEILDAANTAFGYWTLDGVAAAATIFAARGWSGSAVIVNDGITWAEFFQKFGQNFDCLIFLQADGHLKIKALDWGSEVPVLTISQAAEQLVENYECWQDVTEIIDEYKRNYWYHYRLQYYQRQPQDLQASTSWEAQPGSLNQQFIRSNSMSLDVAARIIFFKKNAIAFYNFDLPKTLAGSAFAQNFELGDVITLTHPRNKYYPNVERMIQIYRKKHVGNSNMINFEGIDVTGINMNLIILYEDADSLIVLLHDEADPDCNVLM